MSASEKEPGSDKERFPLQEESDPLRRADMFLRSGMEKISEAIAGKNTAINQLKEEQSSVDDLLQESKRWISASKSEREDLKMQQVRAIEAEDNEKRKVQTTETSHRELLNKAENQLEAISAVSRGAQEREERLEEKMPGRFSGVFRTRRKEDIQKSIDYEESIKIGSERNRTVVEGTIAELEAGRDAELAVLEGALREKTAHAVDLERKVSEMTQEIEAREREASRLRMRAGELENVLLDRLEALRRDEEKAQELRSMLEDMRRNAEHGLYVRTEKAKRESQDLARYSAKLKELGRDDLLNTLRLEEWRRGYEDVVVYIDNVYAKYAGSPEFKERLWNALLPGFIGKSFHEIFRASFILDGYFSDSPQTADLRNLIGARARFIQEMIQEAGVSLITVKALEAPPQGAKTIYGARTDLRLIPEIREKVKAHGRQKGVFVADLVNYGFVAPRERLAPSVVLYNPGEWLDY